MNFICSFLFVLCNIKTCIQKQTFWVWRKSLGFIDEDLSGVMKSTFVSHSVKKFLAVRTECVKQLQLRCDAHTSWMSEDCLRNSCCPLGWGAASSPLCNSSRLDSLLKKSVPPQLLSWSLPRSLPLLLLMLLSRAEERRGLPKGWLRLCTERDLPRLPAQSAGPASWVEESSFKGLTSRLRCLLQSPWDFRGGFFRSWTRPCVEPAPPSTSPSSSSSSSSSTLHLTTTGGARLLSSITSSDMGWTGPRRLGGTMGGSWRVKLPDEEGGGGRSGNCDFLEGVTRVGYGLSGGSRGEGDSEAVDGG